MALYIDISEGEESYEQNETGMCYYSKSIQQTNGWTIFYHGQRTNAI
jgi:hypothetical protein